MSPSADGEEIESPMPLPQNFSAVRRRGAVSAEPITEEDIATYVKKVCNSLWDEEQNLNVFVCSIRNPDFSM